MASKTEEEEDARVKQLTEYLRRLGVDRLAEDISEERFARRIFEAQLLLITLEAREEFERKLQEEIEERLLSLHSQLFDKAATYNNIIVTLGYAGFFAIWNFVSSTINEWDTLVIASLLGFSLLVFIAWTLTIAYLNTRNTSKIASIYSKEFATREERVEAIQKEEHRSGRAAMSVQRWWPFTFFLSVGTGFAAGLMLLILMLTHVSGKDFNFERFFRSALTANTL